MVCIWPTNNVSGCLSPNQHKIHSTTESSTGSNANGQIEKEERGRGHQQRALHWQSQVSLRPHNPYCTDKARSHSDHTTPTALTKPGLTQTTQPLLHWQSQVSLRPRNPYCTDKARSHSDHATPTALTKPGLTQTTQPLLHWQSQISLRPHNPYCTDKARSHSDHATPTALTKPGLTQTTQPLLHWQSQVSLRPCTTQHQLSLQTITTTNYHKMHWNDCVQTGTLLSRMNMRLS